MADVAEEISQPEEAMDLSNQCKGPENAMNESMDPSSKRPREEDGDEVGISKKPNIDDPQQLEEHHVNEERSV